MNSSLLLEQAPQADAGPAFVTRQGGARLASYVSGAGAEAVILLHGGPGVADYLAPVAEALTVTHRVLRYDQRGAGLSRCIDGRYDLDAHLEDLDAVRRHHGLGRIHLLGHAWGGLLAQLYAARHPQVVHRLLLISPAWGLGPAWRRMEAQVMRQYRTHAGPRDALRARLLAAGLLLPAPLGDLAAAALVEALWMPDGDTPLAFAHGAGRAGAAAMRHTRRAIVQADPARLAGVMQRREHDVLVTCGDEDIYGTERGDAWNRFPGATRLILPGTGHLPWVSAPQRFSRLVNSFLSGEGLS